MEISRPSLITGAATLAAIAAGTRLFSPAIAQSGPLAQAFRDRTVMRVIAGEFHEPLVEPA